MLKISGQGPKDLFNSFACSTRAEFFLNGMMFNGFFFALPDRYALLGNSLSVAVVAPLLRYLFSEPV